MAKKKLTKKPAKKASAPTPGLTPVYLIHLEGQGDVEYKFVSKETFQFLTNAKAKDIPGPQIAAIQRHLSSADEIDDKLVSLMEWDGSSPDNDRALRVVCEHAERNEFLFTTKEVIAFCTKHQLEIADEYSGYIY